VAATANCVQTDFEMRRQRRPTVCKPILKCGIIYDMRLQTAFLTWGRNDGI
jgi:hypothetical protein